MNAESPDSIPPAIAAESPALPVPAEAKPNLVLAIAAGSAASLVGAMIWAVVMVTTEMQLGLMAVGVGFLAGYAVGFFNPTRRQVLAWVGAGLALVGCLLGNVLALLGAIAAAKHLSFFQVLGAVDFTLIPAAWRRTSPPSISSSTAARSTRATSSAAKAGRRSDVFVIRIRSGASGQPRATGRLRSLTHSLHEPA